MWYVGYIIHSLPLALVLFAHALHLFTKLNTDDEPMS